MIEIIQSIILGMVQGIGEFLPISSSAHLIFIPYLFNFENNSLAFDVALHFGTLIAVVSVFYKDWIVLLKGVYNKVINKKDSFENKMFCYLVIATIPGAIIGKLLESTVEDIFRNLLIVIVIAFAIMGVLIYIGDKWADKHYKKQLKYEELTLGKTLLIGLSQSIAIFPGLSRSGTTMLTSRILGVSRSASAKFSFMLSVPIIFAASMLKAPELINHMNTSLIVGIISSALFGIISIKFLLSYIKNNDFAIFAYYRIILAIIIIIKMIIIK